jgi:acyl-CoA hydrolase
MFRSFAPGTGPTDLAAFENPITVSGLTIIYAYVLSVGRQGVAVGVRQGQERRHIDITW